MSNKITSNLYDKIISENTVSNNPIEVEWYGIKVEIKPRLSIEEMISFVERVANGNFVGENGGYTPEFDDFVMNREMITAYTNIEMPKDIVKQYDLIMRSRELIELISKNIDIEQLVEMKHAIRVKVDAIVKSNISQAMSKIDEFGSALENLENEFKGLFAGITSEDMTAMLSAITDGGLDESKLINAYFDRKEHDNNLLDNIEENNERSE